MTRLERFVFSLLRTVPIGTLEEAAHHVDATAPPTVDPHLVAYAQALAGFLDEAPNLQETAP